METDETGVQAWLEGVKPNHRSLVKKVDRIIREKIPEIQSAIKWRKPSQPLGIPFYGVEDKGWILALWSFKEKVGIGFMAGSLLSPEPPITTMAGPWNKKGSEVKGRRVDLSDESEFDEEQFTSWLEQAINLPGWGKK